MVRRASCRPFSPQGLLPAQVAAHKAGGGPKGPFGRFQAAFGRRFCTKALTGYKKPRYVEFRDELPKSNVGKILRRELRAQAINTMTRAATP